MIYSIYIWKSFVCFVFVSELAFSIEKTAKKFQTISALGTLGKKIVETPNDFSSNDLFELEKLRSSKHLLPQKMKILYSYLESFYSLKNSKFKKIDRVWALTSDEYLRKRKYNLLINHHLDNKQFQEVNRLFKKLSRMKGGFELDNRTFENVLSQNEMNLRKLIPTIKSIVLKSHVDKFSIQALQYLISKDMQHHSFVLDDKFLTRVAKMNQLEIGVREWILSRVQGPLKVKGGAVRNFRDLEKVEFFLNTKLYEDAERMATALLVRIPEGTKQHRKLLRLFLSIDLRQAKFESCLEKANWLINRYPNTIEGREAKEFVADSLRYLGYLNQAGTSYYKLQSRTAKRSLKNSFRFLSFWSYFAGLKFLDQKKPKQSKFLPFQRDKRITPDSSRYWKIKHAKYISNRDPNELAFQFLKTKGDSIYSSWLLKQYPQFSDQLKLNSIQLKKEANYLPILSKKIALEKEPQIKASELREIYFLSKIWKNGAKYVFKKNFSSLRKKHPKDQVSELAFQLDLYDQVYRGYEIGDLDRYGIYSSLKHQSKNYKMFRKRYPKAYKRYVIKYARFFNINPNLVWSVMRTESHFRANAKSAVGAIGLMQLMPYTAARIINHKFLAKNLMQTLWNPETNIFLGTAYLAFLMDAFENNKYAAIASYNAGPKKVIRWLKSCPSCQSDEFVETIPYRETRRYVKKVLLTMSRYARLYDSNINFTHGMKLPNKLPNASSVF